MVSELRNVDARSERKGITPRQSARRHLPDLDRTFDELARRFGARLETLTTPDGMWGADPTADWPRLPATDLAGPGAWKSPGYSKKSRADFMLAENNSLSRQNNKVLI